jgi:Na+-translocating ferredoxin:NAD+ oxidoreductase RNF subunit RnfB
MSVTAILGAAAILGSIGLVFAALIALTHRRFYVWVDPRIGAVTGMLPGSNCGACGFPGCAVFAERLVDGTAQPASCTQVSDDAVQEIADYLGVAAGEANRRVARLLCGGGCTAAPPRAEYRGLSTCAAAAAVAAGGKSCPWGCLGLADCALACDYDAIVMNGEALPVVIPERCTACGDCVEACPMDLFVLMPMAQQLIVQCVNPIEGDRAEAMCRAACTTCGKCVVDAAPGLISLVGGLAVIDYEKNTLAAPDAAARCPTGAIAWVEGRQFTARPAPALTEVV